jgi:hypothetical protein
LEKKSGKLIFIFSIEEIFSQRERREEDGVCVCVRERERERERERGRGNMMRAKVK